MNIFCKQTVQESLGQEKEWVVVEGVIEKQNRAGFQSAVCFSLLAVNSGVLNSNLFFPVYHWSYFVDFRDP